MPPSRPPRGRGAPLAPEPPRPDLNEAIAAAAARAGRGTSLERIRAAFRSERAIEALAQAIRRMLKEGRE